MTITSCQFIKSIPLKGDLSEIEKPVFAFVGRSNSGKSSLLNTLTRQPKLARTGQTPGVTRKVNLFLANRKFYLADLPGYGYAKMSKFDRKELEELIFWFLLHEENRLKQLYILIDTVTGPTPLDLEFLEFVEKNKIPATIIAAKIDKLKKSQLPAQLKKTYLAAKLLPVIPFSSYTGEGRVPLIDSIFNKLS